MTADRRADIRARLDASNGVALIKDYQGEMVGLQLSVPFKPADAELIAHAPADLAWLLDDAAAARATLAALVADVEAVYSEHAAQYEPNPARLLSDLAAVLAKYAPKEDR